MGRSHGGLTTKVNALTDALGRLRDMILTPGQTGDCPAAAYLIGHPRPGSILLTVKAYEADWLLTAVAGAAPNIRPCGIDSGRPALAGD